MTISPCTRVSPAAWRTGAGASGTEATLGGANWRGGALGATAIDCRGVGAARAGACAESGTAAAEFGAVVSGAGPGAAGNGTGRDSAADTWTEASVAAPLASKACSPGEAARSGKGGGSAATVTTLASDPQMGLPCARRQIRQSL